jgi:hypothetical protein
MSPVEWSKERIYWPKSCIYKHSTYDREMNNVIEVGDEEHFAKGQDSRDLRVSPDPTEPWMQFIETIDSSGDFFRFVESSTREIANNQRRFFKDGSQRRESMENWRR